MTHIRDMDSIFYYSLWLIYSCETFLYRTCPKTIFKLYIVYTKYWLSASYAYNISLGLYPCYTGVANLFQKVSYINMYLMICHYSFRYTVYIITCRIIINCIIILFFLLHREISRFSSLIYTSLYSLYYIRCKGVFKC